MKKAVSAFLILAVFFPIRADEVATKDRWSGPVDGLQARLIFAEGTVVAGCRVPEVYLEIHNVSGGAMHFTFYIDKSLRFEVLTATGEPVPTAARSMDGPMDGPLEIALPRDGTLKFPVTWQEYSIRPNFGTILCFGDAFWEISYADETAYFLSATLEVPKTPRDPLKGPRWHGTIKVPAVKVPTSK